MALRCRGSGIGSRDMSLGGARIGTVGLGWRGDFSVGSSMASRSKEGGGRNIRFRG